MKMDEKGFSLIELLAIIVITSVIIIPLMTTFVNFFEINDRMHDRRNTVGIADVTTNSINRFNYSAIYNSIPTDPTLDNYVLVDESVCATMFTTGSVTQDDDITFCNIVFSLQYNNMTLDTGDLQIYFFNYNLDATEQQDLISDTDLPQEVRDKISSSAFPISDGGNVVDIMRYIVFAKYSDDPRGVIVLDGVMFND